MVEAWSYWAAVGITSQLRGPSVAFIARLSAALAAEGLSLVLAVSPLIPPPGRQPLLMGDDVAALLPLVDGLSVMTYDHNAPDSPGANAPLPWVQANADAFAEVVAR